MNVMDVIKEKGAEIAGKTGIVAAPTSEIMHDTGLLDHVSTIQIISAAGVIWLMMERTQKGLWDAKERGKGPFIFSVCSWSVLWLAFIGLIGYKLL